ncbi:MAG TPA: crossover junction endodeoxyribonuclease RuvC [Candidatus Rifleibacterium sp.]|nr:crossover junction endodeoxyribonuclease RuvC [Candidatus Rifleibacterium sp.]
MTSEPVVGLDLADKLGISVIDRKTEKLLFSASISLARGDTQKRLLRLRECLIEVFTRFSPVEVAIEDVFLPAKTSPRTPIALGELRGVARLCAAERDIPVFFYPPRKVKMAVTDPARVTVSIPGNPDICNVAKYHKIFTPERYDEICSQCRSATIGCVACKKILINSLNTLLDPIRERRAYYEAHKDDVRDIIITGSRKASEIGDAQVALMRNAMHIAI